MEENQPRWPFEFVDLFAGIGGTRLAFERAGGTCVFTCEWDERAVETYKANFDTRHKIHSDISTLNPVDVPNHQILIAGFPCQPFSLAGVVKKASLGRKHGFEDEAQGERFFDLLRIIRSKRPRAFPLENVKNLLGHNMGETFRLVQQELENNGEYLVVKRVFDARSFVPQHRERVIIVAFAPIRESNLTSTRSSFRIPVPSFQTSYTRKMEPKNRKVISQSGRTQLLT